MTSRSTPYLIVAVTGRSLAASAVRGGYRTVVLDCFADRDTRTLADACRSVVSLRGLRFDDRALLRAAETLGRRAGLVYGSGFEGRPDLLARLARRRPLFGNPPDVIAAIRNPKDFFPLLARLGITCPEVRFRPPARPQGWLVKHPGGAGGAHVRLASRAPHRAGTYYQRLEPGRTLSALFLADGRRACVLGINRQWTASARPRRPFLYGGAIGGVSLPRRLVSQLGVGLDALVAATGLVGLNGLDFILQGDRWLVLELNPRPTATVELYDADYPSGLFDWHLRACRGELPARARPPRAIRAHAVVFARTPARATPELQLPRWCHDIPMRGTRFSPGDPVCTVHAAARDASRCMALLRRRVARIDRQLGKQRA